MVEGDNLIFLWVHSRGYVQLASRRDLSFVGENPLKKRLTENFEPRKQQGQLPCPRSHDQQGGPRSGTGCGRALEHPPTLMLMPVCQCMCGSPQPTLGKVSHPLPGSHFHGGFSDSFHAFPFRTGDRFQHGDCYTDTGVRHIDCVIGCDIKLYF